MKRHIFYSPAFAAIIVPNVAHLVVAISVKLWLIARKATLNLIKMGNSVFAANVLIGPTLKVGQM